MIHYFTNWIHFHQHWDATISERLRSWQNSSFNYYRDKLIYWLRLLRQIPSWEQLSLHFNPLRMLFFQYLGLLESRLLSLYHKNISYIPCYLSTTDKMMSRTSFQATEFAKTCHDPVAKESLGEMLLYESTFLPTLYSLALMHRRKKFPHLWFFELKRTGPPRSTWQ